MPDRDHRDRVTVRRVLGVLGGGTLMVALAIGGLVLLAVVLIAGPAVVVARLVEIFLP